MFSAPRLYKEIHTMSETTPPAATPPAAVPPAAAPPAYVPAAATPPAYTPSYAPVAKTNVLSIVSLITSILGFGLVGVITGHIGMNQIKKTGEAGRGLAIAGLIIGYIGIAFGFIIVLIYGAIIFGALATGGMSSF
jgi:hypothetical protein